MDLTSIPIDTWLSQGIFAVLFVYLLWDTRQESAKREEQLNEQINKQNEVQNKIVQTLDRIETKIADLDKYRSDK